MSTKSFSKGLVEIIGSSENSDRVESEILQVFNAIADHKEALDVFRNFGVPAEKKIEAMSNLLGKRVDSMTLDLISLTISQGYGDNLVEISSIIKNLDLVISVDTAILHISAILNKETWGIFNIYPDWRWGALDKINPYNSLVKINQTKFNQWEDVTNGIYERLKIKFKLRKFL